MPELVRHLVEVFSRCRRNVTMDRYFTSIEMMMETTGDELGFSVVGTLRANGKLIPMEVTSPDVQAAGSNIICFRNDVQLAYYCCSRPGKVVLVARPGTVSRWSMPRPTSRRSYYVRVYCNATKGGIDVCEASIESTICLSPTKRWPMRILQYDALSSLNGYHLYCFANPNSMHCDVRHGGRMRFLQALAHKLPEPQLERRAEACRTRGMLNQQKAAPLKLVL